MEERKIERRKDSGTGKEGKKEKLRHIYSQTGKTMT